MTSGPARADNPRVDDRAALRQHIARLFEQRAKAITSDAIAVLPFAGRESSGGEVAERLGTLTLQLLATAARTGGVDPRSQDISDLRRVVREHDVTVGQLYELVYLLERAALDELALDESFGATSEPWPAVAQLVRRGSFDLLAGFADRLAQEAGEDALTDALTTLYTRPVIMAALEKELQRSERFGHPFALILFDVDRLGAINDEHGYGIGDRLLERIGIVLKKFFRDQDWVSRSAGDKFAVLLGETQAAHAVQLADRVRLTLHDRLLLQDYKTDAQVTVSVSVGVVIGAAVDASIGAAEVMREAEQAVHRAKHGGRNRVERAEINVRATTPPLRNNELGS